MSPTLSYDVVVLGAGVAGLTAATRLAEGGARVCVLAKGVGSTHLAPGTVDVLGYAPDRVESPSAALGDFIAAHPDHPYALDRRRRRSAPRSTGSRRRSSTAPSRDTRTSAGSIAIICCRPRPARSAPRPSSRRRWPPATRVPAPRCASSACACSATSIASLCAGNLQRAGIPARAVVVDLDVGRTEANTVVLARRFDDPAFRAAFAARLLPLVRSGERVALPAILGLRDPHGVWSELQDRIGHPVFEIPTLPPSAVGIRVYDALRAALRAAGARLVIGSEVHEVAARR